MIKTLLQFNKVVLLGDYPKNTLGFSLGEIGQAPVGRGIYSVVK